MPWVNRKDPCRCSEACFCCDRPLSPTRHDHDHFPIPARHGGTDTVAACHECHTRKDLAEFELHRIDGKFEVDWPVVMAAMAGFKDLDRKRIYVESRLDRYESRAAGAG
jgi:hypothetical protein